MRKLKRLLCLFSAFLLCLFTVLPAEAADELTLYARWQVQITFDANGGTLSGGITEAASMQADTVQLEAP